MIAPRTWQLRREGFRTLFREAFGVPLVPLQSGTKVPVRGLDLQGILTGGESAQQTGRYFDADLSLNYGVPCLNGHFALDFDDLANYLEFFPNHEKLEAQTLCVLSPHGGVHVWLRTGETVTRRIRFSENLDVLGVGGYAVGPGSVIDHGLCDSDKSKCPHSGLGKYEVIESCRVMTAGAFLPGGSVLSAIAKRAESFGWSGRTRARPVGTIVREGVKPGERNISAFRLSRYLLHYLRLDEGAAWGQLVAWNGGLEKPLRESELRHTFDSARRRPYDWRSAHRRWREV